MKGLLCCSIRIYQSARIPLAGSGQLRSKIANIADAVAVTVPLAGVDRLNREGMQKCSSYRTTGIMAVQNVQRKKRRSSPTVGIQAQRSDGCIQCPVVLLGTSECHRTSGQSASLGVNLS